jgi:hypothetical protein
MTDPTLWFSPESQVSDIVAFVESYAVEVYRATQLQLRVPLTMLGLKGFGSVPTETPAIDITLRVALIGNCMRKGRVPRRWPFSVDSEMIVLVFVGEQWWRFGFEPRKEYRDL